MAIAQIKSSLMLVGSSVFIRLARFGRQLLMAYYLGVSASVDLLLVAQILPSIILAAIQPSELIITVSKKGSGSDRVVALFTLVVMAIAVGLTVPFALSLPFWAHLYAIPSSSYPQFQLLSLLFIVNVFPGLLVSIGTSVAFMKDRYGYYARTTVASELLGLAVIAVLAPSLKITAFALGTVAVAIVNGVLLVALLRSVFSSSREEWQQASAEIAALLRRLFPMSGQVAVSYVGSFLDRALSVRFLQEGYLSRVNYAQAIFEIPNTMIAGSIGTTTYVEQARRRSFGEEPFSDYTRRMFSFMVYLLGALQVMFVAAAPLLLIVFYRRGRFGNDAVESTLLIVELLAFGLVPAGLTTFFERTLYVKDRFRSVFLTFIGRVALKVVLLAALIRTVPHIIPVSTTLSLVAGACLTYYLVNDTPLRRLVSREHVGWLATVAVLNVSFAYFNHRILPLYLAQSSLTIVVVLSAGATATAAAGYLMLKRAGMLEMLSARLLAARS